MNCKGKLIDLSQPKIMGILNATSDSFFAKSRVENVDNALRKAEEMLIHGANFLDVGGMSTRPNSKEISEEEELSRIIPLIESLQKEFSDSLISVDTYRSKVAKESIESGAALINDISAGSLDPDLFSTVAKLQVPYVLMHMQGNPQTMQENPKYDDVILEVNLFFSEKIKMLRELGVNDIILDPGFGFGKTVQHNYQLMAHLKLLGQGEFPVLVGVSRKSMVTKLLDVKNEDALNGTTALHMIALEKGAKTLRVHDVKEAKQAIDIWQMIQQNSN